MVVQHNLQAMNSNRMLGITTSSQSKVTEKLSSGYKINRAADDAAGLSISEKMRKQIRGLDQASANAQDGISSVQTAEGALGEVHDMLQRMNELAVQAANGTNSTSDRTAIQNEIKQLTTEIDRVAETTKFNETYLLKGDVKGSTKTITLKPHDAGLKGSMVYNEGEDIAKFTVPELKESDTIMIGGKQYTIKAAENKDLDEITKDQAYDLMKVELKKANQIGAENPEAVNVGGTAPAFEITLGKQTVAKPLAFNLHVGADADMTNKISVNIETMNSAYLGIKDLNVVDNEDVSPGAQATYAIDAIADAIQKVSDQRSALGAVQNRLEHTIKNLDNVVENTTAAESQIRDTDMASTMVEYTKNNILMQAGQSMLAQANQSTQGVMSLLQ
ncbi:MAG: flagellin [Lachnospiraceae bacterium]|nr:flagellin [Lachnospiraceae bacterium]